MFIQALIGLNNFLAPTCSTLDDIEQLKTTDSHVKRIYIARHGESSFN